MSFSVLNMDLLSFSGAIPKSLKWNFLTSISCNAIYFQNEEYIYSLYPSDRAWLTSADIGAT